jgi:4-aminobutyrate aminotransferase-like enzyme
MRVDSLFIACSSYISGNNSSVLTHLGSLAENNHYGRIQCTELHPETELHTIALPYFIDVDDEQLKTLEKDCLNEIHSRCLYAKMKQDPIKAMVLELILNCTGGILSHHFLEKLAILSKMHDFYFIIDEIITAGRTDTILYTLKMPKAFIDRVMHITLGKWLGVGAVLCFMENVENVDFGRGETTGTNYNKAFAALNLFSKHSDKALS